MPSYNEQQQRYRARKYSTEFDDVLSLTAKKENILDGVQGIVKFAEEFLDLIDCGCYCTSRHCLCSSYEVGCCKFNERSIRRGLSVNHGELTQLSGLVNNLISVGLGCVATFAAVVLEDNVVMEKAWQDIGILRAHAHV